MKDVALVVKDVQDHQNRIVIRAIHILLFLGMIYRRPVLVLAQKDSINLKVN